MWCDCDTEVAFKHRTLDFKEPKQVVSLWIALISNINLKKLFITALYMVTSIQEGLTNQITDVDLTVQRRIIDGLG